MKDVYGSREVSVRAIQMALTSDRQSEQILKEEYAREGIKAAAADFGGEFISSVSKIVERSVVAARREGLISGSHAEEGAVAGAAMEAVSHIMTKAIGLNIGGKIGVARYEDHISVCVFFGIGLLHLNEISIGLGHRAV